MRAAGFLSCVILLAACSGSEEAPVTDSAAVAPAPAAAPATAISVADLAGKWKQEVRAENSDSVLVTSEVTATADPAGWTITLPGRPPMPIRLTVSGDSLITATGPYESVLRKGVQVSTESVLRNENGKLVGITIARYAGAAGADSVVRLRTEMTRIP